MESMDHEQALAVLGLSGSANPDDIEAQYAQRRRVLERRWVTSHSTDEKHVLEAQMRELDAARDAALGQHNGPGMRPAGVGIEVKAGSVIAERYVVRSRLGFGPRGAVYRALDLTWGKDVALKFIAPQLMLVPGASKRLADAVKVTLGLAHSGLANTYGTFETATHTVIANELLDGRTLAEPMVPEGWSQPKSAADILRVIRQLIAALTYAERTSLHLNITPRNVVMAKDGTAKLTDIMLNLAVPILAGRSLVETDNACFIAPEVLVLRRSDTPDLSTLDARADQFSVAAIAYFLATGVSPSYGRKPLGTLRPDLPVHFVSAVERALALAPEARFATHADFLAAASHPTQRISRLFGRLAAATAMVGLIAIAGLGLRQASDTALGAWSQWLPGAREAASTRLQAEALQARATTLRATLTEAQHRLQRRITDARLTLGTAEQVSGLPADGRGDQPSVADARRSVEMMDALSVLVTPRIFNSPDVLNAYNLIGLGTEHMANGRHDETVAILTGAESVLSAKLHDLRQAELLIEQQYGSALPLVDTAEATIPADGTIALLQQTWLDLTDQRRRFIEAVDAGLVLIPAGTFSMGDLAGSGARSESPVRSVAVSAFRIGRYEVTRGEYRACVEAGACLPRGTTDAADMSLPIANLSWLDAQRYVDWLRMKTGDDYRLPSEAEWEYAARAGAFTPYPWGEHVGRGKANCLDCGSTWDGAGPAPVGSFAANAFGLHDMIGNVWEWTADCWYRDYTSAPAVAALREGTGTCEKRVLRGGSWDNAAWLARLSYRAFAPAATQHELYGFRIAKSVE